ncbi:snapalysin family zinc-dependent metalloprotease [Actinokineospora sp. NBRC 105648]|uniref:snapalysin family zinc-dependent metalloprotease n=1 Tax=Actinokineospora sp. NBRC 105648 TaxID=3032206 RepID=UPI0024A4A2BB|nr:snapalysin family zinc-dependent metalloprotease [Actinokineospora sp. NBRC 105648]GLZ36835.1 peptidase [Actinokineospora sp. NBRC 105648]
MLLGSVTAIVFAVAPSASAAAPGASAAPATQQAVRTISYDSSRAAELAPLVDQAAQVWNSGVTNVRLVKGTGGVTVSTAQNGSAPGVASCVGCTRGSITLYRNQIKSSGAGTLRVIVHEFGHILSLNHPQDIGNCDKVMAGGRCDNPQPNAAERAAVDRFWQGRLSIAVEPGGRPDERGVFNVPALAGR